MPSDLVAAVVAYHAAINRLDFRAIEPMFAEQAVYDSGGLGGVVIGRGPIMAGFRAYFDLYPDQISSDSLVEQIDSHRVRSVWTLTAHDRLTGEALVRSGEEIATFDDAGRIERIWVGDHQP